MTVEEVKANALRCLVKDKDLALVSTEMGGAARGGASRGHAPPRLRPVARQRTAGWQPERRVAASTRRSELATLDVGKGRLVSEMAEDDTETVTSEGQNPEENNLPVIQLFSLVEELRYRGGEGGAAGFWGGPYSACGLGPRRDGQGRVEHEETETPTKWGKYSPSPFTAACPPPLN